ncbi:MAG: hypothetical protein AB7T31_14325 [Gemmatimonadales bacterium]
MSAGPVRRQSTTFVLVAVATCVSACASRSSSEPAVVRGLVLPTTTTFDGGLRPVANQASSVRDTVVQGERGRIWDVLPSVFESLSIDAEMMDPTSLVIGTDRVRASRVDGVRLSEFLDCGGGVAAPNADSYDVTLSLFVQLEAEGPSSTLVRTVLDASAQSRYNQSDQIQCASFGTLERRVVGRIDERMRAPSGVAARGPLRRPAAGDFIRLTCASRPEDPTTTSAGELLGFGDGAMLVALGGGEERATVPLSSVLRLEIREQRSRARLSALVGGAVGMATGAIVGRSFYDPGSRTHYKPGVYSTIGSVLGTAGGAMLGGLVGSFVDYDSWVEGDRSFETVRFETGSAPAAPGACPMPTATTR